jgi:hypothetical protein
MPIIIQWDATIYSLFISVNCSTCFRWYLHPTSGAHFTVSTASGISKTLTTKFYERDWTGTAVPLQSRSWKVAVKVLIMPDAVDTVTWAPDDGWRYHPKHVEQFTDINKLYIVAPHWIIIGIHSRCTDSWALNTHITFLTPTICWQCINHKGNNIKPYSIWFHLATKLC